MGPDRARALTRIRSPRELLLLARVLMLAPVVPTLIRLPLPTVERALCRRRPRAARGLDAARVAVVVETAQALAHPVVARGCLTRGVSLFWLLRNRGGGLRLCFGLGGAKDDFTGHCWLERDGAPYLERVDPRVRFPEQYAIPLLSRP